MPPRVGCTPGVKRSNAKDGNKKYQQSQDRDQQLLHGTDHQAQHPPADQSSVYPRGLLLVRLQVDVGLVLDGGVSFLLVVVVVAVDRWSGPYVDPGRTWTLI